MISQPMTLEDAIHQSGEGWLIKWSSPQAQAMPSLLGKLDAANQLARTKCGDDAPDLSETALLAEYARNPHRVRGFFQALGTLGSPEMLVLAWRIIQGMDIKSLEVHYDRLSNFSMTIILEALGEVDEVYESASVRDLKVLRHIGIIQVMDDVLLEGFYPLNLSK